MPARRERCLSRHAAFRIAWTIRILLLFLLVLAELLAWPYLALSMSGIAVISGCRPDDADALIYGLDRDGSLYDLSN
jgi:hypothetical protein